MSLFEHNIQSLNFPFLKTSKGSGVLLTNNYETIDTTIASPDIIFALETAKEKFGADAVYLRYFEDGRSSVPQLYLFDFTNKVLSAEERRRIHISMWNGGQAPAYVIIEKTVISIYDSRQKPSQDPSDSIKEILKLTSDVFNSFNSEKFANGLFWEEHGEANFAFEQSATKDLICGLKKVYLDFQTKSGLDKHVALRLLVQSILIKYLEERDEKSKSGYFASTYFKRNFQCNSFCETIRGGKLLNLLDQLAKDFNGKVFEWNNETDSSARKAIQATEVRELANYLDANIKNSQYVLWPLYSFSYLPVEVISSVYEELLTNSKDIVYTPEMVVSTLIDECMPLNKPQKSFKLIDVSCGSGIFLVKAYKRLVQWWRYDQWLKTGELKKPSLSVLKDLLIKNIYGIDIEQDAIRLSIFSMALAMLDEVDLDPPTWGKLLFPNLENNIINKDFFYHIMSPNRCEDFDLVIGNPPFNLPSINGKEPNRTKYFNVLKDRIGYQSEIKIPDENPALHFLVQSFCLLKPDGLLCMIQPSAPLLYKQRLSFKQDLFSKYNLLQVIDFTKLADKLWGRKNVPTVAVFIQKSEPDEKNVLHLIAGRSFSNKNRLFLEFDHYDFHLIDKYSAANTIFAWKSNLLGGGRIANVVSRLSTMRTIGSYVKSKKNDGWRKGQGFIEGDHTTYKADYITGKNFLPTESLTKNGIAFQDITQCEALYFSWPRNEIIYTPPILLIRKIIGNTGLITGYSDKYLTFKSDIFVIHASEESKNELISIANFLKINSGLLRFYILATSSRVGVLKATSLYDEDILSLPYPADINDAKLSVAEQIVLDDAITYQIGAKTEELYKRCASKSDVVDFANVFCKSLNSIYKTSDKEFCLSAIIDAESYYVIQFEYKKFLSNDYVTEYKENLLKYIESITPLNNHSYATHFQKVMKIYGTDTLIFIKPKQMKYWLKSIALRDADEVFADYIKARYTDA